MKHPVLTRYLAGEDVDLAPIMRELPLGTDTAQAADVVVKLLDFVRRAGKLCKEIPVPVIRDVLAREVTGPIAPMTHLFLRLAVDVECDDVELVAAWQRALLALVAFDSTYAWGSKQRKAKIVALARDPVMLAAIQGTVAHAKQVPLDMLAVLAADGSATSYDALVTHIDAAFESRDRRVDTLARLRTHAVSTPELDRLFSQLDAVLAARNDASPALALGPIIGLGTVTTLVFSARLSSTRKADGVPVVQGSIDVDSRDTRWFRVWVATVVEGGASSSFTDTQQQRDGLGLGRCAPAALPAWLVATADKLGITWDTFELTGSTLRGKKRALVVRWLQPP